MRAEGRIISAYNSFFYVRIEEQGAENSEAIITCKLRGKIKKAKREQAIVTGDRVSIELLSPKEGVIEDLLPRTNILYRPQVANISQVVLSFAAAEPDLHATVLNRFLIQAEWSRIPRIIICLNKMDLAEMAVDRLSYYESIGYPVYYVSAVTGEGVEKLRDALQNEITVFAGPSGVGKSSLLNAIDSTLALKTGSVSAKIKRGRHTTRKAELIPFDGGFVVDTPGFSQLELTSIGEQELAKLFIEFQRYAGECRFSPCSHSHEPQCAIKAAAADGKIIGERYEAYLTMLEEIREK